MLELAKNNIPQVVELPDVTQRRTGAALFDGTLGLVRNVKVRLSASVGHATLTVAELAALKDGSLLKLDKSLGASIDLVLEGQVIARGRLMAVDDHFGVSITELAETPPA
jgi:flagellar motor switch protein FliN/FliY